MFVASQVACHYTFKNDISSYSRLLNVQMGGMGNMGLGMGMGVGTMMGMPNMNGLNMSMSSGCSVGSGSSKYRPLVGGGSAAAYEAARADHYRKLEEKQSGKKNKSGGGSNNNMSPVDAMTSGGMDTNNSISGGGGMPAFGLSVNPNQHYEMLKLHHMNLLNEIQETTLMINLYQQQQLQQQGGGKMGYMGGHQMGGLENMGGGGNANFMMGMMNQNEGSMVSNNMMAAPKAQDNASVGSAGELSGIASNSGGGASSNYAKTPSERTAVLQKLKEDIAQREREVAKLEASLGDDDGGDDEEDSSKSSNSNKRQKVNDAGLTDV